MLRSCRVPSATRQGILDGLEWLRDQINQDTSGDTTALIYYTGHGWRNEDGASKGYYLIPYDMRGGAIPARALRAEDFAAGISEIHPQRLLVILDCCHAGGMGIKQALSESTEGDFAAAPVTLFGSEAVAVDTSDGAKGLESLARGSGRAVLSSSRGDQPSYIRRDHTLSIFTYHLIEALIGHACPAEGAQEVLVSDIVSHVWRHVPRSSTADWGKDQEPDYQLTGNFPVALLLGGQGLGKGELPLDPLASLPAITLGAAVLPDARAEQAETVGRDQIVAGDQVGGDKSTGDTITVGNITGSTGVAIGRGASVHVTTGVPTEQIDSLMQPLLEIVRSAAVETRRASAWHSAGPKRRGQERPACRRQSRCQIAR